MNRSAYYKWLHRGIPAYKAENERIADVIEKIHLESPDKGYRRIKDDLKTYHGIKVNDKRVLRICRKKGIYQAGSTPPVHCRKHLKQGIHSRITKPKMADRRYGIQVLYRR